MVSQSAIANIGIIVVGIRDSVFGNRYSVFGNRCSVSGDGISPSGWVNGDSCMVNRWWARFALPTLHSHEL